MPKFNATTLLLLLALTGNYAQANDEPVVPSTTKEQLPLQELRTFTDIFDRIRTTYVEEVDDKTLFQYAINGMLSSLDPHSAYLTGADFADLQENTTGKFGGLGLEVSMEDGFVLVVSPIDDTPAQKAGIQAGDLIVTINNESIIGLSLNAAIEKMRGPAGSPIQLEVRRKGEKDLLSFTLVRAEIKVTSVRSEMLEQDIGYVRITQFQDNTGSELTDIISNWRNKTTLNGIILDLRNNPGGVLDAAVAVTDVFIDNGLIVYTEGRSPESKTSFSATPYTPAGNIPTVLLINGGSASASEIVAGALQDHQRAVIVGTQSFGKGSVQSVLPLTEDSAVKFTTARYFTPNGRSIQAQGIKPDIWVEQSEVTPYEQRSFKEANLPGHLSNPTEAETKSVPKAPRAAPASKEPSAPKKGSAADLLKKDFQLYEAYTLLRGLQILRPKQEN